MERQILDGARGIITSKKSLWLAGVLGFLVYLPDTGVWSTVAKALAVGAVGVAYQHAQGSVDKQKAALLNDPGSPLPAKPAKKGVK